MFDDFICRVCRLPSSFVNNLLLSIFFFWQICLPLLATSVLIELLRYFDIFFLSFSHSFVSVCYFSPLFWRLSLYYFIFQWSVYFFILLSSNFRLWSSGFTSYAIYFLSLVFSSFFPLHQFSIFLFLFVYFLNNLSEYLALVTSLHLSFVCVFYLLSSSFYHSSVYTSLLSSVNGIYLPLTFVWRLSFVTCFHHFSFYHRHSSAVNPLFPIPYL